MFSVPVCRSSVRRRVIRSLWVEIAGLRTTHQVRFLWGCCEVHGPCWSASIHRLLKCCRVVWNCLRRDPVVVVRACIVTGDIHFLRRVVADCLMAACRAGWRLVVSVADVEGCCSHTMWSTSGYRCCCATLAEAECFENCRLAVLARCQHGGGVCGVDGKKFAAFRESTARQAMWTHRPSSTCGRL